MCGIFGVADWRGGPLDVGALAKATNLLRHRGPDGGAHWTDRGVFFGHRRHSTLGQVSPAAFERRTVTHAA